MERAAQDGYITHRTIHEKIIMHQPSWSYASSISQPPWRWSYQQGKSYTRWLHHTPINTRKDYHASTFMIIRIKHNPTILALFQLHLSSRAQWSLLRIKTAVRIMINIRRCDQTSRWSPIITADIVPALGSLPTFRSISNYTDLSCNLECKRGPINFDPETSYCTHSQVPLVITLLTVQCYWKPKPPFNVQKSNPA